MLADAKKRNLLYVSSYYDTAEYVYVYTYPGGTLEGTLTGFLGPQGECVDKAGDVFITNYFKADIIEYAHGGSSPIATLQDQPYSNPDDCSLDPTTGNLAVSNAFGSSDRGNVAIYKNASGSPQILADPNLFELFACAYDNMGNLFIDGYDNSLKFALAELSKGSSTFVGIAVPKKIRVYSAIQWDGKYVALGNVDKNRVYQLQISGAKAKIVGSTPLTDGNHVDFFSVVKLGSGKTKLVGPDYGGANVKIWEYPAGGVSIKTIGGVYAPVGTAVSPAEK